MVRAQVCAKTCCCPCLQFGQNAAAGSPCERDTW
jgi:hypothetical protein